MGKRMTTLAQEVDADKLYALEEGAELVKKTAKAKFDETVELHVKLGIDPKQSDQQVRGTTALPHGTGRTRRVAVVAKGPKADEAKAAGADLVGDKELVDDIQKGKLDFDVLVATPDMMRELAKLGKVLGPRGLMPNPKSGTVTMNLKQAVTELKAGRVEFKGDPTGIIHVAVGKASFDAAKIAENVKAVLAALVKAKPSAAKGAYIQSITIAATMGPGIHIDPAPYSG